MEATDCFKSADGKFLGNIAAKVPTTNVRTHIVIQTENNVSVIPSGTVHCRFTWGPEDKRLIIVRHPSEVHSKMFAQLFTRECPGCKEPCK